MANPLVSELRSPSSAYSVADTSSHLSAKELILVIVQHPELLARPELAEAFRPDEGLLLVRCSHGDPSAYISTMYLPCVYVAQTSLLSSLEDLVALQAQPSCQHARILLIGPPISPEEVKNLILGGAAGYLSHKAPLSELKKAVRAVVRGEYWADRLALSQLIRELIAVPATANLTRRELDVLKLLPAGHTNRSIADTLGVTYETVRWHLRSIYAKLGVKDRAGAMIHAKYVLNLGGRSITVRARNDANKPRVMPLPRKF